MDVYIITNTVTKRSYVGSTHSFRERMKQHFYALGKHKHFSKQMQEDFDLYGRDSFACRVIGQYDTKKDMLRMEKFFICILRATDERYGYNTIGNDKDATSVRTQAKPLTVLNKSDYRGLEKVTLACARVSINMTQTQMAKRLGISTGYYNKIENGIIDPSPIYIYNISKLTGFPVNNLLIPSRTA